MPTNISDFIKPQNFKRCEHYVYIRNETSSTQFTEPTKVKIIEFFDNGLSLELPKNVCQLGHNLTLFFIPNDKKRDYKIKIPLNGGHVKEAQLEILGKVDSVTKIENQKEFVSVQISFTQYNVKAWKALLKKHTDNQNEINDLVSLQRGGNDDDN